MCGRGGKIIRPSRRTRMTKGTIRMNDKRNYIKMTLAALTVLGIMVLFYLLSPIPALQLQ